MKHSRIGKKFIDKLRIYVKAGKGGDGLAAYKGVGGNGGDVYVRGKDNITLNSLNKQSAPSRFFAESGTNSKSKTLLGANGKRIEISVPVGISVRLDDNKLLGDINKDGEKILVAKGGQGGCDKNYFMGQKGEAKSINLDLKLIADIGLVGFPNAGKSTLLSVLSRAKPKIAALPFTTLQPQLGIIHYDDLRKISVADLPGLVEGAHMNVGMGHKFLKHIERTKMLLFIVDVYGFQLSTAHPCRSAIQNIFFLQKELELYNPILLSKPAVLVINKIDVKGGEEQSKLITKNILNPLDAINSVPLEYRPSNIVHFDKIFSISAKRQIGVPELKNDVRTFLDYYSDLSRKQENYDFENDTKANLYI